MLFNDLKHILPPMPVNEMTVKYHFSLKIPNFN